MSRLSYFDIGRQYELGYDKARTNLYENHEPLYMYHISPRQLHDSTGSMTLSPKSIFAGEDEVFHIKRICVAPTIEQCLIAIAPGSSERFYVYRTHSPVNKSVIPYGVLDAPLTQERWLTRQRKFNLTAVIHRGEYLEDYGGDEILSHEWDEEGAYPNFIILDFNSRGGRNDFHRQHKELHKTRKFLRKHDSNMFLNEIEKQIHDKQRDMKLRINRYDLNRLCSTGSR